MPYRVDFHAHTGHSSDSLLPVERLLAGAVDRGLTALAVTDHNTLDGALQAVTVAARLPERFGGLMVLPGEEVKTTEGELIGLFLRQSVPRGLTPEETIARFREQDALIIVPHPFDRLRGSRLREAALNRVAGMVDAIEGFNARTTLAADNARALAFARAHGLPVVAGSDAHAAMEVGMAYLELDQPPATNRADLLAQIRRGQIRGRLSRPTVHLHSKLASWRKRLGVAPRVQL